MTNQNFSTPSKLPDMTYRLQGKASRAWYMFLITQTAPVLIFIVAMPILFAFMCLAVGTHPNQALINECIVVGILTIPVEIGMALYGLRIAQEHLRRARLISVSEDGLLLKALNRDSKVNWLEVIDVFPTTSNEFVLWTNRGDYFFSKDMDRSNQLYETIKAKLAEETSYDFALCEQEGYRLQMTVGIAAVLIAVVFSYAKHFAIYKALPPIDAATAAFIFVIFALLGFGIFVLAKTPQCIRVGSDGILLKDKRGCHKIGWNSISKISKTAIGPIIATSVGWYLVPWSLFMGVEKKKSERAARNAIKEEFFQATLPRLGRRL